MLPGHHGHEERSVQLLEELCDRLPVPNRFRDLAKHVARHHGTVHRAAELKPQTVLKVIMEVDGLRQPDRFEEFLLACEADARGRKGLEERPYPQAERFRTALRAARGVDASRVRSRARARGRSARQGAARGAARGGQSRRGTRSEREADVASSRLSARR